MNADQKRKAQVVLAWVLVGIFLSVMTESSWARGGGGGHGGGGRGGGARAGGFHQGGWGGGGWRGGGWRGGGWRGGGWRGGGWRDGGWRGGWRDGGWRGGWGDGWRGGWGEGWGFAGFGLGLGLGYGAWAWNDPLFYDPYPVGFPVYEAPPTVVVSAPVSPQETTYVGPATQEDDPPAGGAHDWFYCESAKGYYPYVESCPEPWHAVPSTPNGPVQP